MTDEILSNLRRIKLINPGPLALKAITENGSKRNMNLDQLVVVDKKCCWCNEAEIKPPKRRYCSDDCSTSASMNANPQSSTVRAYLLIERQDFACVKCGEFQQIIVDRYQHWLRNYKNRWIEHFDERKVTYHFLGDQIGHLLQVDHIRAIQNGGQGCGLDNVQVLCTACHQRKTRLDNYRSRIAHR